MTAGRANEGQGAASARCADRLLHLVATEQAEQRLPSIVAGVVRDGQLVWTGARGQVQEGGAPDADVQYRCGSITKTFVAACIMRLRDEGAFALTDRLEEHLAGTGAGEVTIGQLLSHSGGLRAETGGPWWERTPGGDLAELSAGSLAGGSGGRFEAARRFHYSNVGYGLLGAVLEAKRGTPWAEVVQAELLEPLGMTRTTTRPVPPAAPGLAVHPWADLTMPEPEHDHGAMGPAGQLWTTIADLARWATFLHGGHQGHGGQGHDVLDPATRAEMREARVVADIAGQPWAMAYGLGLQLWNAGGVRTFGHGGSMPGFRSSLEITEEGDAAIAMANATNGLRGGLTGALLRALAEEEPRLPGEWRRDPPALGVLEVVGTWYWGPAPHTLRARAGMLELAAVGEGGRASRFRPTGTDAWVGLDGYHTGEPLVAVRDADGSVSHLDLGSFVFTRAPYDPAGPVPGDVTGWGSSDHF